MNARNDKDVEGGQGSAGPDTGLTAEEQAIFDGQREAPPAGGAAAQAGADQQQQGQQAGAQQGADQQQGGAAQGQQQVDQSQAGQVQQGTAQQGQQAAQDGAAQQGAQAGAAGQQADEEDTIEDDGTPKIDPATGLAKPPPRRVNWNKYDRMQQRAKKAEATAQEREQALVQAQIENAKVMERLTLLAEALGGGRAQQGQQQQQQEDKEPPEDDVFAHQAWLKRKTLRLESQLNDMMQGNQEQNADKQVISTYQSDAAMFSQQVPEFPMAYNFLLASRAMELSQLMFGKNPQTTQLTAAEMTELRDSIAQEERSLVTRAIQQRRSPSAVLYDLAKGRGFEQYMAQARAQQQGGQQQQQGGQQQQPAQQQAGQQGAAPPLQPQQQNGQQQPAQGQQQGQGAPSVTERLATLRNGQQAAQSLSQGVGVSTVQLTPQAIVDMSDADFAALYDSLTPAQQRSAMGGA